MSTKLPSIYRDTSNLENRVEILERVINNIDYVEFRGTDIDITKYCTAWSNGGTPYGTATCSFSAYHLGKIEATINFSAGFSGASFDPHSFSFTIPFSAIGKYGNDNSNEDKPAISGAATVSANVSFNVSQDGTQITLSYGGNNMVAAATTGSIIFQGYWK